jgi:hypothetical protein
MQFEIIPALHFEFHSGREEETGEEASRAMTSLLMLS